ncbi:MAG TPA: diguanylate cyclase [Telluria sp.]|nr:diguanylate cyclase [Telluria sp.]
MKAQQYERLGWWFAVLLLPGIVIGMFAVASQYQQGKADLAMRSLHAARALSQGVDGEVLRLQVTLETLARAPALAANDYVHFQLEATEMLPPRADAGVISLLAAGGRELASTGPPLPHGLLDAALRTCLARGAVTLTDLFLDPSTGRASIAMLVPVSRAATALAYRVPATVFHTEAWQRQLPPKWIAGIVDRNGHVVGRSRDAGRYVGQEAQPAVAAAVKARPEGTLEVTTFEGEPGFAGFTRAPYSGWSVVVVAPRGLLLQPLYRAVGWMALAVALTLLTGGASAYGMNRALLQAVRHLRDAADRAAAGQPGVRAQVVAPREIAELAERFNHMQERREHDEQRLRLAASVFSAASEGILIVDAQLKIIEVNDAFLAMSGYRREELEGQHPRILHSGRQPAGFYEAMWETLRRDGQYGCQLWDRRRDGTPFAARLNISTVRDDAGNLQHFVALFTDVTEAEHEHEQIAQMAFTDPLTGLANRRLMQDRLERALASAQRTRHLVAVCAIDLDGFKEVNDQRGHEAGDAVLVAVAERLGHVVRANDTVARMGGDEFTLVLVDLPHRDEADDVARRALAAVREPVPLAEPPPAGVSGSIGIALYPTDAQDAATLQKRADEAMYEAKRRGRDQIVRTRELAQTKKPGS